VNLYTQQEKVTTEKDNPIFKEHLEKKVLRKKEKAPRPLYLQ